MEYITKFKIGYGGFIIPTVYEIHKKPHTKTKTHYENEKC